MSKARPQNRFNISLTRSQLELLEKSLSQEIAALESGYAHPHPKILKSTFDAVWVHLQPSPEAKQKKFERWVRKVCGGVRGSRMRNVNAHAEFSKVAI
jgi:hypothetical protein